MSPCRGTLAHGGEACNWSRFTVSVSSTASDVTLRRLDRHAGTPRSCSSDGPEVACPPRPRARRRTAPGNRRTRRRRRSRAHLADGVGDAPTGCLAPDRGGGHVRVRAKAPAGVTFVDVCNQLRRPGSGALRPPLAFELPGGRRAHGRASIGKADPKRTIRHVAPPPASVGRADHPS